MTATTVTRRLTLALLLVMVLGACSDDSAFEQTEVTGAPTSSGTLDPLAPGVTGTVPLPGPADWLEWTPAETPSAAAEAELVAALEELGMAMVIPASAPPMGGPASAIFNSQASGWGSGETFADTAQISLNVVGDTGGHVVISSPPGIGSCSEGEATLTVRGDTTACAVAEGDSSQVWWEEGGQSFRAAFSDGLTLDQGLAWLETWRLLP